MTVTLAHLFPNFDDLIQTPADVQRLNEAILQLAVQGKLVPQDPTDEPAGVLLARIQKAKQELETAGQIRKLKPPNLPHLDAQPFSVPNSWMWVQLQDVYDVRDGTHDTPNYLDEGIPFVTSKNLSDGKIDFSTAKYISLDDHKRFSERSNVEPYDILFAMIGSIGNPVIIEQGDFSCKNVAIFKYYNLSLSNPRFLYYFLLKASTEMRENALGGVQSFVSLKFLREYLLPLPPLAEQKRIVAKVDELLAQTRALAAKLRRAQEEIVVVNRAVLHRVQRAPDAATFQHAWATLRDHFTDLTSDPRTLTDLRQTILQLAVQGKLVPQDPADEPASALLQRIAAEKNQKTISVSTIPDAEQLYRLPDNWQWIKFGTICEHRLGKMLDNQKNKGEYRPYLRNLNVQWDRIDFDDIQVMRFEPHEFDEYQLLPGDLLICEGGEPGRCAIWEKTDTEMMFQKAIHRARPCSGIVSRYLLFYLQADATSGRLAEYFTGATIKHFTGKALADYWIALPPLAEQKRIVAKVDELLARCNALAGNLGAAQVAAGHLTAAVLAQAVA